MDNKIVPAPEFPELAEFVGDYSNLADARLGAEVVSVSDEFFAAASRMLDPSPPVLKKDTFDEHGGWMDGWESRRKREAGHDWAIVKLANRGIAHKVDFETTFFTGNFAPAIMLEGVLSETHIPPPDAPWQPVLDEIALVGDQHHLLELEHSGGPYTHIRVSIYPDGGIARFRLYGRFVLDSTDCDTEVDLAAALNGGTAVSWNDSHYGHPQLTLMPGRGINMGDGWETRRRREPGFDWAIVRLGSPGVVSRLEIDTLHFKGNFPHQCSVDGAYLPDAAPASLESRAIYWNTLLEPVEMGAHVLHTFTDLNSLGPLSHIKINLIPDGGISRLRAFGIPSKG